MKILKDILFIFTFCITASHAFGQISSSFGYDGRFSDTIPYTLIENKMIIEGKINGKTAKFILDTGGERSLFSRDSIAYYGAIKEGSGMIGDGSKASVNMEAGYLPNVSLGNHFTISKAYAIFCPPSVFFKNTVGVVGTIGADMLRDIVLSIHSKEGYIIISYPYRPNGRSKEGAVEASFKGNMPFVNFSIQEQSVTALFDTGASFFFALSPKDYQILSEKGLVNNVAKLKGHYEVGITGNRSNEDSNMGLSVINGLKIGDKQFDKVNTLTRGSNKTMMGVLLTKYGNVMIDYPRELFFFYPFESSISDASKTTKVWNISIITKWKKPGFYISAVLGDAGVNLDDRIWSINGIPLESIDWKTVTFNTYLDNLEGDEAIIEVGETKNKLKKVTIKRF